MGAPSRHQPAQPNIMPIELSVSLAGGLSTNPTDSMHETSIELKILLQCDYKFLSLYFLMPQNKDPYA